MLKNRTIRYSSPLAFNDPFDFQSGLHFDFDIDKLQSKVLDRLHEFAAAPIEPQVDREDVWGRLVLEVRKYYPTHGFPRDRWQSMGAEPFAWLVQQIRLTQKKYQEHWWSKLLPGLRVLCVCEERDNLLMWAHYAKDHTGAVLEFWSLPEEDNPLSVAQAVKYVDSPPSFFTEAEWLDDLTAIKKLNSDALYQRYAYAKSTHWAYEREWRVWYPLAESGLHEYMPIRSSEFTSLYFGCRALPKFRDEALALVRSNFPQVRAFQACKREGAFALDYKEI